MTGTPQSLADRPPLAHGDDTLLINLLRTVRLSGSVYMDACFSAPFDVVAPRKFDVESPVGRLHHVSIFHMISSGSCRIDVAGSGPQELSEGDIIWIPLGHEHRFWSGTAISANAAELFRPGPLRDMWQINHGGGGDETRMICGWIESSEFLLQPMFRSLPPFIIERLGDDKVSAVMTSTVRNILDLAYAATPGTELILGRLMETLFIEVLRRYAGRLPESEKGWFAALRDPIVSRAMALVHADAGRHWTIEELARDTGTSRSVLAERFQDVMGRAPIDYVTTWRMQLAANRLRASRDSLAVIAADIGYESEAAFSRAFKRVTGLTPGKWRDGSLPSL